MSNALSSICLAMTAPARIHSDSHYVSLCITWDPSSAISRRGCHRITPRRRSKAHGVSISSGMVLDARAAGTNAQAADAVYAPRSPAWKPGQSPRRSVLEPCHAALQRDMAEKPLITSMILRVPPRIIARCFGKRCSLAGNISRRALNRQGECLTGTFLLQETGRDDPRDPHGDDDHVAIVPPGFSMPAFAGRIAASLRAESDHPLPLMARHQGGSRAGSLLSADAN